MRKVKTPMSYSSEALWMRFTWFLGEDSDPYPCGFLLVTHGNDPGYSEKK